MLELLIVTIISAGITLTVALFVQRSITSYRKTDQQAELDARVKIAVDHIRKVVRSSVSGLSNFHNGDNGWSSPATAPFTPGPTLFFLTDHDNDSAWEINCIFLDSHDGTKNPNGTDQFIHAYSEYAPPGFPPSTDWKTIRLPPDLQEPAAGTPPPYGFMDFLALLRTPSNFKDDLNNRRNDLDRGHTILFPGPGESANFPFSVNNLTFTTLPPPVNLEATYGDISFDVELDLDVFLDLNRNGTPEDEEAQHQGTYKFNMEMFPGKGFQ